MKKYLPLFIILLSLTPNSVFADIIYLKAGGSVECVIEKETDNEVTAIVNIGKLVYLKTLVASVSRSSDEGNAKLKEKWRAQKQQRETKQEQWKKFAAEQKAKGLILCKGQWITKDEYEKLNKPAVEETKKVKYVFEPITNLPLKPKKIPSSGNNYQDKLGKVSDLALKRDKTQIYYLYLPKDYSDDKKWPLFIGIHGYMADGKQAMDLWKDYADKEGFILICPSFKDGYQRLEFASDYRLIDIIKETQESFSIDKEKIFLAGFSGGAQFAHRFALRHPEYVNSVVVLAAGSYDYPVNSSSAKHIKFLVGVGANDSERLEITRKFVEQLTNNGYHVKFEIFPNAGHEVPPAAKQLAIEFFKDMESKKF